METPTGIRESVARIGCVLKEMTDADDSDTDSALRDLLTEIRHYCEAKNIDLNERLDASYEVYLEEKQGQPS